MVCWTGSLEFPSYPKAKRPKVKQSSISLKSFSIVWNFPVGAFNLLMSAGLEWGTLAEVHDSDDMKSLYYGKFEATALLCIWDGEVSV